MLGPIDPLLVGRYPLCFMVIESLSGFAKNIHRCGMPFVSEFHSLCSLCGWQGSP